MTSVLVTFYSQTGNTEKVAGAISTKLIEKGCDCLLKSLENVSAEELGTYDLLFIGSACHSSTLAPPVLEMLQKIPAGSLLKTAGFATHSCHPPDGSQRDSELYNKWASGCPRAFQSAADEGRIELLGYFGCVGAPSPPIQDFIHSTIITDETEWMAYKADVAKHPDDEDLNRAADFAVTILEKLK